MSENEISIIGIENTQQHEFVVDIHLRNIDHCDHLDDKIYLLFMLFDKQKIELSKNPQSGEFHINQTISIKFKSSLSDLIVYFRNIFALPIVLASIEDDAKGTCWLEVIIA